VKYACGPELFEHRLHTGDRHGESDPDTPGLAARVCEPYIAVFTPITFPPESSSGPPLLPGLMAASVWITSIGAPSSFSSSRPSELTIPW